MQMEIKLASESHVPRFRAGVGTWRSRYMIKIRLPWRHRARPSATLHEIPLCPERQSYPYDGIWAGGVRQELLVVSEFTRAWLFGAGAPRSKPSVLRSSSSSGQWMP